MIKDYALFYSYSKSRDLLEVKFSNEEITYSLEQENVTVNFHNVDLVSYEITGINKIMKIHVDGMIYLPNNAMVDVINSLLKQSGLETLAYKDHSDFYVGEVIQTSPSIILNSSFGEVEINEKCSLREKDRVIFVLKHTFVNINKYATENHICTYKDLDIANKDEVMLVDLSINDDFFNTKEED